MHRIRVPLRAVIVLAAVCVLASPAQALRVATWNVLAFDPAYPPNLVAARQPAFRTVLEALAPDILIAQELNYVTGKDSILADLNAFEPGQWTGAWLMLGTEGGGFFWKPAKVGITNITSVVTGGPRPVMLGVVRPVGYVNKNAWFRLYSMHLKAGQPSASTTDSTTRRQECASLRSTLNNQITTVVGPNFLVGGDTNFYGSWEGGYQRLTESQANNNGQCLDPLDMPGTWNTNPAYQQYDTQCPCLTGCSAIQSGGGMDDRFDLILSSTTLRDGAGLELLPSTYTAFGNDAAHYNADINGFGFNVSVGITVANALHDASDHIPVIVTLQLPAKAAGESQLAWGDVIVGAPGAGTLHLSNIAVAPADLLRYTLSAPPGYSAPAGPFALAAGGTDEQSIVLSAAAAGVYNGTLSVLSNDVDSTTKNVLLSARVLDHAAASLDSTFVVTTGGLDFGAHPAAGFTDLPVRVFNAGWNALRARLSLAGAAISGGDGRFSIAGGFTPALIGSPGVPVPVRFDPAGATTDSTYTATLTFTGSDEPLPGAQASSPLEVSLSARVVPGGAGAQDGALVLRLLPPSPNPAHTGAQLAYELPARANVELAVYDLGGRRVAQLARGAQEPGRHSLWWDRRDDRGQALPAGLYFVRFAAPGLRAVARLAVLD